MSIKFFSILQNKYYDYINKDVIKKQNLKKNVLQFVSETCSLHRFMQFFSNVKLIMVRYKYSIIFETDRKFSYNCFSFTILHEYYTFFWIN